MDGERWPDITEVTVIDETYDICEETGTEKETQTDSVGVVTVRTRKKIDAVIVIATKTSNDKPYCGNKCNSVTGYK